MLGTARCISELMLVPLVSVARAHLGFASLAKWNETDFRRRLGIIGRNLKGGNSSVGKPACSWINAPVRATGRADYSDAAAMQLFCEAREFNVLPAALSSPGRLENPQSSHFVVDR